MHACNAYIYNIIIHAYSHAYVHLTIVILVSSYHTFLDILFR